MNIHLVKTQPKETGTCSFYRGYDPKENVYLDANARFFGDMYTEGLPTHMWITDVEPGEDDALAEMRRNEELAVKGLKFLCGIEGPLEDLVAHEELVGVLAMGVLDNEVFHQVRAIVDRRRVQRDRSKQ